MTSASTPYRQLTVRTSGPDDTRALAAAVTRGVREGDAIVLTGELGAGKTVFAQGVARALGIERRVTSPTFTILRHYEDGSIRLVHVDVYRLNDMQDFIELGEESLLGPDEVTLIEWGDTVAPLLPRDRLEVELLLGQDEEERIAHLRGHGAWAARIADLLAELGPWLLDDAREA